MYRRISHLFFPDPLLWVAMASMAALLAVWSYLADFTIHYGDSLAIFYMAGGAAGLGLIYHKRAPVVAIFAFSFAIFILSSAILRPLSYLGAAAGFTTVDAPMAWFDRAIGFDWVAHVAWVNENPLVYQVLAGAYESLVAQLLFVFFVFYVTSNTERLREFIMLFFGMGIVTTLIATFTPAAGAYLYYQPAEQFTSNLSPQAGRYALEHFLALQNGTMRSMSLSDSIGLVTVPSFHTQAALLYIWAMRRTIMFWPFAVLNGLMILSTLAVGGHFVGDLLAGGAVAAVVVYAYGVWAGRYRWSLTSPRVDKIARATGFNPQIPVLAKLRVAMKQKRDQATV